MYPYPNGHWNQPIYFWGYNENNWNQVNQGVPVIQGAYQSGRIDFGSNPFVVDIEKATTQNNYFRRTLWTGDHLQVTLMSIEVGEDIGLEVHPNTDQFLRIEDGQGLVMMGDHENYLDFQQPVYQDDAIMVPAGKYHNLINTGPTPLRLYSIYAPPEHPYGTVHETKEVAVKAEDHHD
ncbi:cupin domain-containing protein [Piscibacillus halophilus]|uniref:Mannose-6-phosphate isomerase, cupin superfamily n=1 Tax=Piscibacillus halophilus TaxID=571933 RepID=A0A1H9KUA6_9BACI|nr:cupin domain-containing protein [Piscibacillus halophilus]SER02710.1 Mannose-6-phosphate isomerase, cupin superfamily [Piscibacillus halophilus]